VNREQELIDIMFQIAQFSAIYHKADTKDAYFEKHAAHMEWVAEQLRQCGFDTQPMGASWGVLKK
jgi:hypothetical protein